MQATTTFKHFTPLRERKIKIKVLNQNSLHVQNSLVHNTTVTNSVILDTNVINRQNSQGVQYSKHNLTQNSTDVGDHSQNKNRSVSSYLNTDFTENKQNSAIHLITEQANLTEYCTTQDINQFRIKKTLPIKSQRPQSSMGGGNSDQKLMIRQSILNNYINYNKQVDGFKSIIDAERKRNDTSNKRLRSSEGYYSQNSNELNKHFLNSVKVQISDFEKVMQIIDDKYNRKSESLEQIMKEIDIMDQKVRQVETNIRNIQQKNNDQGDLLKIQSIISTISTLQSRIQSYQSISQQNDQVRTDSQQRMHNNSMQNIYSNSLQNDQQYGEKQRNFAEFVFDKFNNTLKIISTLKKNQVNEALDLMLQLNQELQIISNTTEMPYNFRAQSLQYLYELDCQIPHIFNLLMKVLNNQNDSDDSAIKYESLNQMYQVQKSVNKPASNSSDQNIEQLDAGYQNYYTKLNQESILNKNLSINFSQGQTINLQDNDINWKSNQTHSNVFRVSNGVNKQRSANRSHSKQSVKSSQKQIKTQINKNLMPSNNKQNESSTIYSNAVQKNEIINFNQSVECKNAYIRQDALKQDFIRLDSQMTENSYHVNSLDKPSLNSQLNQNKDNNNLNSSIPQNNINTHNNIQKKESQTIKNNLNEQDKDIRQQQSMSQSKSEYIKKDDGQIKDNNQSNNIIQEMFKQIRALILHQNIIFSKRIIQQLIEYLEKSEYQDKQKIIDILVESQQYFNQLNEQQIQMNTIPQYDMFQIDDEIFWNSLQDIHKQKQLLTQIKRKLHEVFLINDMFNEDKELEIEIQDFNDLRQVMLKLVDKTDFPLLSIALPNNLVVHENIVNEIKQRVLQTQDILKEVIEIISDITIICQRQTFRTYKLITFSNPFFTNSEKILQLLNSSSIQHFSLLNLLDLYSNLKKQFQREKQISKVKQIVDRLLFIRLYDELITKSFNNIEQDILNSLQRGEFKLNTLEQHLNQLFQNTNQIRILLLDNNYDFNRIDNFKAILQDYVQLITIYISIYNTNESIFVSGRDQSFELIEQIYSFIFFTKSLSKPQPTRSKSPIVQHSTTIRHQSYQNTDSYYFNHIKKIQKQTLKDIRKKIEIYFQQLNTSSERLQSFIQQHEQQIQNAQQLQNSFYDKTKSSLEQKSTQTIIKENFQIRLVELNEQLNILIQNIASLLQKPQIQVIDLLHLTQEITQYLKIKKEDIAIVQNEQQQTIFALPYNFGADCQLIVQQISNFMHHNNQQNIQDSLKNLQPLPQTDIQSPTGPITLVYSASKTQLVELYIYNNCPTESNQVGELVISNAIDGQILLKDYVETNNEILKLQLQFSNPYIIASVKFANFKQKQSIMLQSDVSIMELKKKDLNSSERQFKIIIQQTDPSPIVRQSFQYFIHAKNSAQNEYIINQETSDPNEYVKKESINSPNDQVIIKIQQNKMYEYTLYANLILSDVFQVFKNGKVAINQVNITQIHQDNPHTWRIFQIPKLKSRIQTSKK